MITEFKVSISQPEINDLKERIRKTRWLGETENSNWNFGTEINYLKELSDYWENEFDWRKIEDKTNSFPNYIAHIGNFKVHFLHIKSEQKNAMPLLISHLTDKGQLFR